MPSFPSVSGAYGVWSLSDVRNSIRGNTWPVSTNATGGSISTAIENGIRYTVHTFTSSGTFDVISSNDITQVEYLVVGGGGAGGGFDGGGGGAGEIQSGTKTVSNQAYTVVVGAGGSGEVTPPDNSGNVEPGQDSSFDDIVALGGGRGESNNSNSNLDGGSGGGGQGVTSSTYKGSAIGTGFGNDGGAGSGDDGAGGGGAGQSGEDGGSQGGNGGDGLQFSITGESVYYAGGGGGGGETNTSGGLGGGGDGGQIGGNGMLHTGGGGGGIDNSSTAGNGGSGIVIIRYPS